MSKTKVYKLNSDTNKGFPRAPLFQTSWEGWKEKNISDTVPGGFTMCSRHAASPHQVLISREANSDNFHTYSADVALDLVQHCYRGQEAEIPFLGSPLQCSDPTWNVELWALLGILYPLQGSQIK